MSNLRAKVISMDTINQNELIVKSNNLIEASYRLTTQEQRVILLVSSMIKADDKDFQEYYIDIKSFMNLIGVTGKSKYEEIKEITKKLRERTIVLKDLEKNTETQMGWVSSFTYFNNEGYVQIMLDPKLKPFLLNLKERFTQYQRKYVIQLKSFYSIRLYELLKQYEKVKERYIELDALRKILGIKPNEYKLYGNFKNKVLKKAEAELPEKTDLKFKYKEKKQGRKVVGIYFFIEPNNQITPYDDIGEIESLNIDLYKRLQDFFCLTQKQARIVMKSKDENELLENLAYAEKKYRNGEVKELGPYTLKIIKENIKIQGSLFDFEKKKKDEKKRKEQALGQQIDKIADLQKEYRVFCTKLAKDAYGKLKREEQAQYIEQFKIDIIGKYEKDSFNYQRLIKALKKNLIDNIDFMQFLKNSSLITTHSFIDWAAEYHQTQIVQNAQTGDYEIVEK